MGTFIREYGKAHIPGEKREAFLKDVRTVALQGGLFRRDYLSVFGKNIVLLGTAEAGDEDGYLDFTYSYYEDDRWENAGINLKECRPYSNKVGWRQFNQAVQAVHILAELYSDTPCFSLNDSYNRPAGTIQWLRYVLKRELHYAWRNHIWHALEMAAQEQAEYSDAPVIKPDFVYKIAGDEADGMELLDAVVVTSDLKGFLPEVRKAASEQEEGIISYSYALAALYDEVTAFKESSSLTEEEQIAYLFRFLMGFDAKKDKEMLDRHTRIAVMTTVLSPPISVKVISELYGKNFWSLWWQVKDNARKEGAVSAEGLEEVEEYREMGTEEFFHIDPRDRLY